MDKKSNFNYLADSVMNLLKGLESLDDATLTKVMENPQVLESVLVLINTCDKIQREDFGNDTTFPESSSMLN